MTYINFTKKISNRARNSFSSRTDVLRDIFEEARQKAIAENESVSLVGYCYRNDLEYVLKHVSCIEHNNIDTGNNKYFCKFVVTKDTKIS